MDLITNATEVATAAILGASTNTSRSSTTEQEYQQFISRNRESNFIELIAYLILFVIGSSSNLYVFHQLMLPENRNKRMNSLLRHLTFADLMVIFVAMTMEILQRIVIVWYFGEFMCKFMNMFKIFTLYSSSNIIVCIALDRFFAFVRPLSIVTAEERNKQFLIASYCLSFLQSIPQLFVFKIEEHRRFTGVYRCAASRLDDWMESTYAIVSTSFLYILPLIIIVCCYIKIIQSVTSSALIEVSDTGEEDEDEKWKKRRGKAGGAGRRKTKSPIRVSIKLAPITNDAQEGKKTTGPKADQRREEETKVMKRGDGEETKRNKSERSGEKVDEEPAAAGGKSCSETGTARAAGEKEEKDFNNGDGSFLEGKQQESREWKRCSARRTEKDEFDLIPQTSSSLEMAEVSSSVSFGVHQESHSSSCEQQLNENQNEKPKAPTSLFRHHHLLDQISLRVSKGRRKKSLCNLCEEDTDNEEAITDGGIKSTGSNHIQHSSSTRGSQRKCQSANQTSNQKGTTARAAIMDRARKRTLKMTIAIVLTFILCWTPYAVMVIWYQVHMSSALSMTPSWLMSLLWVFAYTNSVLDPFVHSNHLFRVSFAQFMTRRRRAHDNLNGSLSNEITVESHL